MMARRYSRTYRSAAQAHAKVTAARQELLSASAAAPAPTPVPEEPMHRYSHSIPLAAQAVETVTPTRSGGEDSSAAMTQVLEQLSCQSQLLVDLLGAVNSLTAALLAQNGKS